MVRTTVVIPNYKGIDYIGGCLRSLYEGSVPVDVILVDNHSADGSLKLVRQDFPQVKIVAFSENKGFPAAVNAEIRVAETEYVLLLNNDTAADTKLVEQLENALDAHPEAFSVSAKMLQMKNPEKLDGAGDFYCAFGWAFARGKDRTADRLRDPDRVFSACGGCALYRRSLFSRIGLFDENHFAYLEDIDIGYRANIYGYPNRYEPKAVVYHAGSAASGSKHNAFKVTLSAKNSIYLIYKNMPVLQIIINLPFLAAGYLVKAAFFSLKGLGKDYLKGLSEGFMLSCSKEGKARKVSFKWKNLKNYFWIQIQLWVNICRLLWGR